jgi:phage gpG-like protein
MTFGERTVVRYVGGELIARQLGETTESMRHGLLGIARRSADMTPPFGKFERVFYAQERRIFKAQGIPRWEPLQTRYAAWKASQYPGRGILVRDGRLMASLTRRTRDTVFVPRPRSLQIGTRVPYSAIHQAGFGTTPQREHVVLLPETFDVLARMTMEYILSKRGRRYGR